MLTSVQLPTIKGYEIQEKLAAGGMGVVYRARDITLGREVAIKMIRADLLESDEEDLEQSLSRFMTEARAVAQIRSNHVSQVLQFGKTESGDLFLVLEFLDGVTLNHVLRKKGAMSVERCINVGKQMCHGMQAAHRLGIVHRDLKPSNVMLVEQDGSVDFVKILDFGVAKRLGEADSGVTQQGMIVGTYTCMAPEQVIGQTIDARTDIYAMGVLLYRMAVGRPPFKGKNTAAVLYHHVNTVAPFPSTMAKQKVPRGFDLVVRACLEKNPEKRPASMNALHDMLAKVDLNDFGPPVQVTQEVDIAPTLAMSAAALNINPSLPNGLTEEEKTEAVPTPFPTLADEQTPQTVSSAQFAPAMTNLGAPQPTIVDAEAFSNISVVEPASQIPAPSSAQRMAIPQEPSQSVAPVSPKSSNLLRAAFAAVLVLLAITVVGVLVIGFNRDNKAPPLATVPVQAAKPSPVETKTPTDPEPKTEAQTAPLDVETEEQDTPNDEKEKVPATEDKAPDETEATKAIAKAAPKKKTSSKKVKKTAKKVSSKKSKTKKTSTKSDAKAKKKANEDALKETKKSPFIRVRTDDK